MNNDQKTCRHCLKPKPRDAFGKHSYASDGLQSYCKECSNKYKKGDYLKRSVKHGSNDLEFTLSRNDLKLVVEILMEDHVKKIRRHMTLIFVGTVLFFVGLTFVRHLLERVQP